MTRSSRIAAAHASASKGVDATNTSFAAPPRPPPLSPSSSPLSGSPLYRTAFSYAAHSLLLASILSLASSGAVDAVLSKSRSACSVSVFGLLFGVFVTFYRS